MLVARGLTTLLVFLLAYGVDAREAPSGGIWTRRSLARYARARHGAWRGRGRLTNTLSGTRIADVDYVEETVVSEDADSDCVAIGSRRELVFSAADGQALAPPLRYAHNVSMKIAENGHLFLRAGAPDGSSAVASGWGVGRGPSRRGLRRCYEISVRPLARDAAADTAAPASEAPDGWPRTANRGALGVTREDYTLLGALRPGGRRALIYRRTGRCPSWYGAGVCTLEVEACTEPPPLLCALRARLGRMASRRGRGDDGASTGDAEAAGEGDHKSTSG